MGSTTKLVRCKKLKYSEFLNYTRSKSKNKKKGKINVSITHFVKMSSTYKTNDYFYIKKKKQIKMSETFLEFMQNNLCHFLPQYIRHVTSIVDEKSIEEVLKT